MGAAAVPIGLAAFGAIQGAEEQKEQKRFNKGQAEMTKFSDVTGRMGQLRHGAKGPLSGAVQGGFSGMSFNAANPSAFGGAATGSQDLLSQAPQQSFVGAPIQGQRRGSFGQLGQGSGFSFS